MKKNRAFTLVEVLITIVIFSMLAFAILNIFDFQVKSFHMSNIRAQTQSYVRNISKAISSQIRFSKEVEVLNALPSTLDSKYAYIYSESGAIVYISPEKGANKSKTMILNPESSVSKIDANYINSQALSLDFEIDENLKKNLTFNITAKQSGLGNKDYVSSSSARTENATFLNYKTLSFNLDTDTGKKIAKGKILKLLPTKELDLDNIGSPKYNETWYSLMQKGLTNPNFYKVNPVTAEIKIQSNSAFDNSFSTTNVLVASITDASIPDNLKNNIDKYNYSIDFKTDIQGARNGYRILVNGAVSQSGTMFSNMKNISGYALEFKPDEGFLLRRVEYGKVDTSDDYGIYRLGSIDKGDFKLGVDYLNDGSTMYNPHNVNIKVLTDKHSGQISLRVILKDENGNESQPMYFGDSGERRLANGTVIRGQKLPPISADSSNFSNTTNEPILGFQSTYLDDKNKGSVTFGNVDFGEAPPDPVKATSTVVTVPATPTSSQKYNQSVEIAFNKQLNTGNIPSASNFSIVDNHGNAYSVSSTSIGTNSITLKLDGLEKTLDMNSYTVAYDGKSNITDAKGNTLQKFDYRPVVN